MRSHHLISPIAAVLLLSLSVVGQKGSPRQYTPGLDLASIDRSVDPCDDFYHYACGAWQKNNPIPPDQVSWDVSSKMYEENLSFLRRLLETAANSRRRDAVSREIGDFYAACMNESASDRLAVAAIQPELKAISGAKSKADLASLVAHLQLEFPGNPIIFGSGSRTDFDDSSKKIAGISQGGLGLPDRDYYLLDDSKYTEIRGRYLQHVRKMFELLGVRPPLAKADADGVIRMETALARASLTQIERRDPYKSKNKMSVADLSKLTPNFDWREYFLALNAPAFDVVNVGAPAFFKEFNTLLAAESIDNWKIYLRYHVANSFAPYLSRSFVQENFDFYRKYLRGAKEMQPRWKRCVQYTDDNLGDALGQAYVRKVFPPELKASTTDMVRRIEDAMEQRIRDLDWMSSETKQQALVKLHAIRNKIGYPDKWRDYSSVKIVPNNFVADIRNAVIFEDHRDLNKIGKPVDRDEWPFTPSTVNAGYTATMNAITFPAGVLQPPLYDSRMDDAPNYGDTGSNIGHELTHGFDDLGRRFDANGNLRDWWTKTDAERFKERADCLVEQYARYVVVDDVHVNGNLTLGENIADLGGSILAYVAWKGATKDKQLASIDGFTPSQRFFIGFAQWACSNDRPEDLRARATSDPHAPAQYRINGVVVNMPEFEQAFQCRAGSVMAPVKRCALW